VADARRKPQLAALLALGVLKFAFHHRLPSSQQPSQWPLQDRRTQVCLDGSHSACIIDFYLDFHQELGKLKWHLRCSRDIYTGSSSTADPEVTFISNALWSARICCPACLGDTADKEPYLAAGYAVVYSCCSSISQLSEFIARLTLSEHPTGWAAQQQ
jgi:hypothetical protein